ncbi:hypothetical protein G1C97_1327 [Bifidobacterium sp. DSM 109959]|uniref:CTP synthase n=2 Tax=Bifidobacterium olomucense TaxID=2675324 RepID=A0A7Y0EXT0_9BIFI|nr:hypothetical protein [Bifidobacterium sp. DSM 109959]
MLRAAEQEGRCVYGRTRAQRQALLRRRRSGELISPYCNLYADRGYWNDLNNEQRSLHTIRALAKLHPQWVFTGLSAACLYGVEHSYTLHDGAVYIVSRSGASRKDEFHLNRIYMNQIVAYEREGILLTSPARMLLDCSGFEFPLALALFDSAMRKSLTTVDEVRSLAAQSICPEQLVNKLLQYVDPRSENGGESMMRGCIVDRNFAIPLLQVEFDNPGNPAMPYRVDFCWKLADGRIIVAEFDGMEKYADTSNRYRASLQAKMEYERRREQDLKEQGITVVVHIVFEDLTSPWRLESKLIRAGVPKNR